MDDAAVNLELLNPKWFDVDGAENVEPPVKDFVKLTPRWKLTKFKDPYGWIAKMMGAGLDPEIIHNLMGQDPYAVDLIPGNVALKQGIFNIIGLIANSSGTKWSSALAKLGIGNSVTAASASQTALLGSHIYVGMDAGYPTRTSTTVKWRGTASGTVGNISWQEYTVSTTATNTGINLNRKVLSKGTKAAGESWSLELQVTIT